MTCTVHIEQHGKFYFIFYRYCILLKAINKLYIIHYIKKHLFIFYIILYLHFVGLLGLFVDSDKQYINVYIFHYYTSKYICLFLYVFNILFVKFYFISYYIQFYFLCCL